ncbi:MAG: L-lactate dehydrogenase, partial [Clostridia bacterium]|nr:L-lactate dehydrogenase [Clostridia bacterium]
MNHRKCAIIGCGNVGATIAYTYTMSGLFSDIVLIDLDEKRAEGEAMDLSHGVPFLSPVTIKAGGYPDLADASIIVIAAGAAQKEGQTRLQLLSANLRVFSSIV